MWNQDLNAAEKRRRHTQSQVSAPSCWQMGAGRRLSICLSACRFTSRTISSFFQHLFPPPQHILPPVSLKLAEMFPERSFQTSPDAALSHQAPASVRLWHVSASGTIHYWVNLLHMLVTVPAPPLRPAPATCQVGGVFVTRSVLTIHFKAELLWMSGGVQLHTAFCTRTVRSM